MPRYPRHWPFAVMWAIGLLLSVWILLGLAYIVGRKAPTDPKGVPDAVVAGASSPGTAVAMAFGALVLGGWCLRHLCLHWLAWQPGRIEVADFTAGSRLSEADVARLTIQFRRQLATLRLQAPTPVPGAAPEGDYLDVLGRSAVDSRNVLGTLLSVLRAAIPTHAYELHGVLQERDTAPRFGITVQVVRVPTETSLPVVAWGDTWDDALRRAADDATSLILPRTRRCRSPWSAWRRHQMPAGLLHAYEDGTRLEQERRYDEALHTYYAASALDPMNMVLRLRIGQMQERLGLYLDAVATYCGMLTTSRPAGTRLPLLRYRGGGRRERRRALTSARYRRNVLLGGRVLADQWVRRPGERGAGKRDVQRTRLRAGMRQHMLDALVETSDAAERERVEAILDESAEKGQQSRRYLELRDLLADFALRDCRRLFWRMRTRRLDRRATLTPATIALTQECIRVRKRWVAAQRGDKVRWPPPCEELDKAVTSIERGPRGRIPVIGGRARRFRFWHEHYNAACVFALPLLSARAAAGETNEYARAAVRRLELATARADSAYLASRRDWLLSEDPDLKGLRTTTAFKNFEVMHLPASEVTPRRPERVQQLESSRYVRALLVATAETWQATWHARGRSLGAPPEIRDVLGWFGDELAMWELVREVALDYRHAGTRHKLITTLRDCSDRYRFDPVHVGSPRYETKPLKEDHESCDDAADREITHADDVLEAIAKFLRTDGIEEPAESLLDRLERWQSRLHERAATAREPSRLLIAALCDHHAAMWQLLAAWLQADEAAAELAGKSFREKADETRKLWCTALSGWRMFSEGLLAFAGRGGADHPAPGVVLRYQLRSWSRGRAVGSHNSDGVATARDTFG